jgi:hypothetical protein
MTRQEIEKDYVIDHGRIASPGKFEGEPLFVPYFWDCYLNGGADGDDGETLMFEVTNEDRKEFPELVNIYRVFLWEDSNGFVSSSHSD